MSFDSTISCYIVLAANIIYFVMLAEWRRGHDLYVQCLSAQAGYLFFVSSFGQGQGQLGDFLQEFHSFLVCFWHCCIPLLN